MNTGEQSKALKDISVRVNGTLVQNRVEPRKLLSDFLREHGFTGVHVGCEHGVCGACTILFNGDAVRSCLMFAVQADGAEITTVEGLAKDGKLTPVQEAFRKHHALQCGFCTPGQVISATDFLRKNPNPTEEEIREAMSGNLCRCTGYHPVIEAVKEAATRSQCDTDR